MMHLHDTKIRSLLLFWQPIFRYTSLYSSIGPYLKQQRVRYAQILPIAVTENPILGVTLRLLPRFTGDSTMHGVEGKGAINIGKFCNKNKHNISPMIIPMPPVSLAFLITFESLNSSSSADPHRLHN